MNCKWNIELVKKKTIELSNNKIECISNKYKNTNTKLEFKCKKYGVFFRTWGHFNSGRMCPECISSVRGFSKYSLDHIKSRVEKNGKYELLSTTYEGCKSKLKIDCSECSTSKRRGF